MKIFKPKFWDKKGNFFSLVLLPLSLITILIIYLKKFYKKKNKFTIPIICFGNIYIGGTGKTPTSINIAQRLKQRGKKPVIIRKFYKNHSDEYNLIKNHCENLILSKSRFNAIREAENKKFDIVILDDGFQDYGIIKNLNIVCFNQKQLVGNGLVFPAGPLRESFSALKDAHLVIINGKKDKIFENKILSVNKKVEVFYSKYEPVNVDKFKNKRLLAFAGIGNPNNFFDLLSCNGLSVEKKLAFPDHYEFSRNEVKDIVNIAKKNNYQILTTEKDYYRIKDYQFNEINYLKLDLKINNENKFIERILRLYD